MKPTTENRLAKIVAKRYDLTDDETAELVGRNLAELTSHARHLIGRRKAVEAAKERSPGSPSYAVEGAYDGGGVTIDNRAGKELAAQALADRVNGHDPQTTALFGRIGERTLDRNEDRNNRITDRLRAAGYAAEGN